MLFIAICHTVGGYFFCFNLTTDCLFLSSIIRGISHPETANILYVAVMGMVNFPLCVLGVQR